MGIVKELFEYTFVRRDNERSLIQASEIVIDEVPEPTSDNTAVKRQRTKSDPEIRARIDIAIYCNRVIGLALLLSLSFMIVFSFTNPNKAIPSAISRIAWACLGYFGSAMATFLGSRKKP